MNPTEKELDARLKLNQVEKRNQLLLRVKGRRLLSTATLIACLGGSCMMGLFLWGVYKAHQPMLLGLMAFFAYSFATISSNCASNEVHQRINALIELIGEENLVRHTDEKQP